MRLIFCVLFSSEKIISQAFPTSWVSVLPISFLEVRMKEKRFTFNAILNFSIFFFFFNLFDLFFRYRFFLSYIMN